MRFPILYHVPPLYHGTNSINLKAIERMGFNASLSGFGQSLLSGLGLLPDILTAETYAQSKARWEGGNPVVLEVTLPPGKWADLRGFNLPLEILESAAIQEDVDVGNFQEFRNWYKHYQSTKHPLSLSKLLIKRGFDGAVIDSTLGAKHPAPEYVWFKSENAKYKILSSVRTNPAPIDYYKIMFNKIPLRTDYIESIINLVINTYKRRDRITYLLRLHRYYDTTALLIDGVTHRAHKAKQTKALSDQEKEVCQKIVSNFERKFGKYTHEQIEEYLTQFAHYMDMMNNNRIQSMQTLIWDKQRLPALLSQLEELEQEYLSTIDDNDRHFTPDDESEIILSFDNNIYWVLLNSSNSSQEAQSMGHCGGASEMGWLLSLRSRNVNGTVTSHLTFEWHPVDINATWASTWGILSQMKGFKNSKPTQNYHKYIIELLKQPQIQVLVKGNYKPETDFSLDDLDDQIKKELLSKKPQLASWKYLDANKLLEFLMGGAMLKPEIGPSMKIEGDNLVIKQADQIYDLVEELIPRMHLSQNQKHTIKYAIKLLKFESHYEVSFERHYKPDIKHWFKLIQTNFPEKYHQIKEKLDNNQLSELDFQSVLIRAEESGWEVGTLDFLQTAFKNFAKRIVWKTPVQIDIDSQSQEAKLIISYKHLAKLLDQLEIDRLLRLDSEDIEEFFLQIETVPHLEIRDDFDEKACLESFGDLITELL